MSNDATKQKYNFLLALAFIGIGSWKTYGYFYDDDEMANYQVVLAVLLIAFGIFQLWRWNKQRKKD